MPHNFQEATLLRQKGDLACNLPHACLYTACCIHRLVEQRCKVANSQSRSLPNTRDHVRLLMPFCILPYPV